MEDITIIKLHRVTELAHDRDKWKKLVQTTVDHIKRTRLKNTSRFQTRYRRIRKYFQNRITLTRIMTVFGTSQLN